MAILQILIDDHVTRLSPLCKGQIDPTRLNISHPLKHIPNSNYDAQPFSLFLNQAQRDIIIGKITTNSTIQSIIEPLIHQTGGDFRLFIDLDVSLLFPEDTQELDFLSYDAATQTHKKIKMTWIGLCLDFESVQQSSTRIVASLHTIFPIEPHIKSLDATTNGAISIQIITKAFRKEQVFDIKGNEKKSLARFIPETEGHDIFQRSSRSKNEETISSEVVKSLESLPFSVCTLPNLNFYQSKVEGCITSLSNAIDTTVIDSQLSELGIAATERQPIITQLNLFNAQSFTNSSDLLKTLKDAQRIAQELITSINQAAENALVKRYFPEVSDEQLKRAFEHIIQELQKKDNKLITVTLGDKEFCIDLDNGTSRKDKLVKFTNCLKLMGSAGLSFDPFKSAKTILGRYQIIDGHKLYAHPVLNNVIAVVKEKKTLIENGIAAIDELKKTEENFNRIEKLLKENNVIQKRQFESPQNELLDIKNRISSSILFDRNIIDQLKRHIAQNEATYEVTRKVDIQVGIFCTQLRTRFLGQLIDLLNNIAKEKNSFTLLQSLDRDLVKLFFIIENDTLKLDKRVIVNRVTSSNSGLYEFIMSTQELMWELNRLILQKVIDDKLKALIKDLAETIQDIHKIRTTYPYAFQLEFTSSNSAHPSQENIRDILIMAIDSLLNRIEIEEKYTLALKSNAQSKSASSNETQAATSSIQKQRQIISKTLTPGRDVYISIIGIVNFLDQLNSWFASNIPQVAISIGPFYKSPPVPSSYTTPQPALILSN